ncbi:MAG: extracellular solute-binding protein [Spirochaetia bacterium]|nr:extracellular solute-binding protein [Spirochaetia bacterium]
MQSFVILLFLLSTPMLVHSRGNSESPAKAPELKNEMETESGLLRSNGVSIRFGNYAKDISDADADADANANADANEFDDDAEADQKGIFLEAERIPPEGVPLGAYTPVYFEIGSISLKTGSGEEMRLECPRLEEQLYDMRLFSRSGGIELVAPCLEQNLLERSVLDQSVKDLKELQIEGTPLQNRPLEVWVSWEGAEHIKNAIRTYAESHGGDISIEEIPKTAAKLTAYERSGQPMPDLVMVQSDYLPQLIMERAIQPMHTPPALAEPGEPANPAEPAKPGEPAEPANPGAEVSAFLNRGLEAFTLRDELWAIPFYADTQLLVYNPEIIDPELFDAGRLTLERFEEILEQVKERAEREGRSIVPASWNIFSAYWLAAFQYGFGKETLIQRDIHGDAYVSVMDGPTEEALRYLLDLRERGLLDPLERDGMTAKFIQGQVGAILTGSYALPYLKRLGVPFAAAPYPVNGETGAAAAPLLDFKGFAVPRRSRNPVGARRLMDYLSSFEVQRQLPELMAKIPVERGALSLLSGDKELFAVTVAAAGVGEQEEEEEEEGDDDFADASAAGFPESEALLANLETGVTVPPSPAYSVYKDVMWSMLRLIITGKIPLQEGLERAQDLIDSRLEDIEGYF